MEQVIVCPTCRRRIREDYFGPRTHYTITAKGRAVLAQLRAAAR